MLFIDSSHEREPTVLEFTAWRPRLAPGAVVVFDDHGHPDWPGVAEAVGDLGLAGEVRGGALRVALVRRDGTPAVMRRKARNPLLYCGVACP